MNLRRRQLITALGGAGLLGLGWTAWRWWPDDGLRNPCLGQPLPQELANHELMQQAWEDIDPTQFWDGHVHLLGLGDSPSGIWTNPDMDRLLHPIQYTQKKFYLNASCVTDDGDGDNSFVRHLLLQQNGFPAGTKIILLAFEYHYNEQGQRQPEFSPYHTPNDYAMRIARRHPQHFEWIASIHPYREDAIPALQHALANGARAVKWLPPAMGMDPASARCDDFYRVLAQNNIPLLCHTGHEEAVHSPGMQELGNPLRLRRALEQGVRVIAAHCGYLGDGIDLDHGHAGPKIANFELFRRLMEEPQYQGQLYGEISALGQILRAGKPLMDLILQQHWHRRLAYASDYPLPGVMPIFSTRRLIQQGYLAAPEARFLKQVRQYNPLLFDFLLKRFIRHQGAGFQASVFQTRHLFGPQT